MFGAYNTVEAHKTILIYYAYCELQAVPTFPINSLLFSDDIRKKASIQSLLSVQHTERRHKPPKAARCGLLALMF